MVLLTATLPQAEPAAEEYSVQETLTLPVRVINADGELVPGAVVTPWSLVTRQGTGQWRADGYGNSEPPTCTTDAEGRANVLYPRYAMVKERVRTIQVTLSVDHPDYAHIAGFFSPAIDVPRQEQGPHVVTLQRGVSVEIEPILHGKPAPLKGLYAFWSDGRSWKPGVSPTATDDGALRIPPMPAGSVQLLLVRLDGKRATHFSQIIELELEGGAIVRERVELRPAVRIQGALSDNVPRPVQNGRLKARTLPKESDPGKVAWRTWVPIAEDGKLVIDAWPAGESAQLIALCDGYIAESGDAPDTIKDSGSGFQRPQIFSPHALSENITLQMAPLVHCIIETVDEKESPLSGVEVGAFPNVLWWSFGSQIYCHPLVRGERLLLGRHYRKCADKDFPLPFKTVTDARGLGELHLPVGAEDLYAEHDDYELPIVRGRREQDVRLVANETTTMRLVLQPKGKEHLGEWDNLADYYGKEPPKWNVSDARGVDKNVTLADFKGKWVLVEFWGLRCGGCLSRSLPSLMKFYDEHIDQRDRFQILAFNVDEDIGSISELDLRLVPIVKKTWGGRSLPFPILVDTTTTTKENFNVGSLPSAVLIDPDGTVVKGGRLSLEMLEKELASTRANP